MSQTTGLTVISIHAPRVGSDLLKQTQKQLQENFNPRSPCGERPTVAQSARMRVTISIHAPRVGSDAVWDEMAAALRISIHAPRVGSD